MKYKRFFVFVCILGLFFLLLWGWNKSSGSLTKVEEIITKASLNMDWDMVSKTMDTPAVFTNAVGNTIIYHFLTTQYSSTAPAEISGVNLQAIQGIIDPETAEEVVSRRVNENDALLCTKGRRAYLCWTLSPEYSFVIEYTPTAVTEAEILTMAEHLHLP